MHAKKLRQEFKVSFIWWCIHCYTWVTGRWVSKIFSKHIHTPLEMWVSFDSRRISEKWWRIVPSAQARVNFEDSNFWNNNVYFFWAMFVEFAESFLLRCGFFLLFVLFLKTYVFFVFYLFWRLKFTNNQARIVKKQDEKKMKMCHDRHSWRVFQ